VRPVRTLIMITAVALPAAVACAPQGSARYAAAPAPAAEAKAAPAGVLWEADPAKGTSVFDGLEKAPGSITVADDPKGQYGASFRYETWDNADGTKERCESRGMRKPDGSVLSLNSSQVGKTFYLGWRALWNPMPITKGKWTALYQLHISGQSSSQPSAGPFVLRTLGDGQLHFQLTSPSGGDRHIWNAPLSLNKWNSFVIGFKLARDNSGWVEFWYNGVQQKFTDGSTRVSAPTLWGDHVNNKWGVYRSGPNSGHAVAYLNRARLGTTYAAVAP
jgi:Polysaccharide lyase